MSIAIAWNYNDCTFLAVDRRFTDFDVDGNIVKYYDVPRSKYINLGKCVVTGCGLTIACKDVEISIIERFSGKDFELSELLEFTLSLCKSAYVKYVKPEMKMNDHLPQLGFMIVSHDRHFLFSSMHNFEVTEVTENYTTSSFAPFSDPKHAGEIMKRFARICSKPIDTLRETIFEAAKECPEISPDCDIVAVGKDGVYVENPNPEPEFHHLKLSKDRSYAVIRTADSGARVLLGEYNSLQTYNATDQLEGPVWGPVTGGRYGDVHLYSKGVPVLRFYNTLTDGFNMEPVGAYKLGLGAYGKTTVPLGDWNFANATVSGLDVEIRFDFGE